MAEVRFSTAVNEADLQAALQFIGKRVKRRDNNPIEGMGAALYSVMFMIGEGLTECGMPATAVGSMFDQLKAQVLFDLHARSASPEATA